MAVKITDIAEKAGVSRGTVDRVLHNRGSVKPEVEERIRSIAKELGFVPNRAGKVLAAQKQKIKLCCLLPDVGNPFFEDVIKGFLKAQKELNDFNVTVEIKHVKGFSIEDHINKIKEVSEEGFNGLCLTTLNVEPIQKEINKLALKNIPVVVVNTPIDNIKKVCYVGPNYYSAGLTAAGMFSKSFKSAQSLVIVTGSFNISGHMDRIKGFCDGLMQHQINYEVAEIFESEDDDIISYNKTKASLENFSNVTTVFIAAAGVQGASKAVKESGRHIHVVAFDDIGTTREFIKEGLIDFTICQNPIEQGYNSLMTLFSYIMDEGKIKKVDFITHNTIKIAENIDE